MIILIVYTEVSHPMCGRRHGPAWSLPMIVSSGDLAASMIGTYGILSDHWVDLEQGWI